MLNRIYSYFFNKSSQIRESFSKEEGQAPWRARVFSIFALFIFELLTAFLKFTILLTQPSYESFQTFTRQHTLPVCEYSYFDHKRFQKRVRLFSLAGLSSVVSATIIINLIMSLILPGQLPSYAKTVTGGWDDWSLTNLAGDPPVGSAGSLTISPANYSEISGTGTDSVLQLKTIPYWVQDDGAITKSDGTGGYGTSSATGGTFGAGTNSNTTVSGTGTGASVGLAINNGGTGADGAYNCASGTCSLTGATYNYTTFNISSGATVNATGTTALVIRVIGNVTIAGTLNLNGLNGENGGGIRIGGIGGAGGYNGGSNVSGNGGSNGSGPGGGLVELNSVGGGGGNGGAGGAMGGGSNGGGIYTTEEGGSGGSGAGYDSGSGAGGGGYLKITNNGSITNSGVINANGGAGGNGCCGVWGVNGAYPGGGGSGGRIKLNSSLSITNSGAINANGGKGGDATWDGGYNSGAGGGGGGRINLVSPSIVSGTISVSGGAGGAQNNGGINGVAGAIGIITTSTTDIPPFDYFSSGTFESAPINLGAAVKPTTASFNQTISSSTAINGWGDNSSGQTTIPSGLANVVAIAGGSNHSLALKSDGTVVGWGYNGSGQTTIPSGLANIVAIAGGDSHSLALKSDGTVVGWGLNASGQRTIPSGLANVVAIAGGEAHSLALKSDGTVVGWGNNSSGQTTIPSGLANVVAIAGEGNHSLALKSDGTVVGWGNNGFGQTTIPSGLANVVAIAGGNYHSLALVGGLRFQIAGNTDNSTWTYKPLPRQVGVASNRLVIPSDLNGSQYIRYKAYLSTDNSAYTPSLDNLKINYSSYPATSTVSNLKFDSGSSNVTWSQVQWVRQDANTAVSTIKTKAQVRVASSDAGLTGSFVGYNGTTTNAGTYFDKFGSGQTNCSEVPGKFGDTSDPNANKKTVTCLLLSTDTVINPAVGIGSNRWLELQLTLESDGSSTPQIDATRVIYAANKAPGVTIAVSPVIEQSKIIADIGYVTFNASINDEDTGTGTTLPLGDTGWAFVALEYSTTGSFGTEPTISSHSYFNGTNFASAGNFTITRTSSNITKNCIAVTDSSALTTEASSSIPSRNTWTFPSTSAWKYACPVDKTLDASGNSVTFTDYSVRWNVKNQIDNTYSPSTAKVRLWTTDMEGANSVGYTTSSGFIINTTNPTGSISKFSAIPAGVSGDTTSPGIYITANDDDTTISYKLSDNCYSGASGDWATLYTSWVSPVSSPIGCSFLTTNENTGRIYAPYFSLKDSYGNEKAASAPMTSGQRPINIVLQDVSNVLATPASYKLFMSWEVIATPVNGFASYNIYRCSAPESDPTCSQNSNYSLYNAVTGGTAVNYFTDSNVTGAATYYYRIATKDFVGNISNWSAPLKACVNGTQDCDEGGGGGDTTPPTISSIQIPPASITQNSAIITWTTSETANAGVFYSTNTSYGSEKSSLSYATSQSITLSGLSSGATYNIKLKSIDASGNTTICDAVSSSSITTVTNKTTATNSSTYCPAGATLSFTTLTTDTTAPVISNVSISSITSSGATVAWTTNENSDSYIGSDSATSARTYLNEQGNSDSATSHSVTIGALSSTTTYYIKIKSRDASGNLAQNCSTENKTDCPSVSDASLTFTTTAPVSAGGGGGGGGKSDFTAPGISDIKISDITSSSAVAVWQTNELASSFVEYGIKKDNLDRTQGQFDNVSDHKVALKDLAEGVKYYYKIKSVDWAGNVGESDIQTFTTKGIALSLAETAMSEADKEKTQAVLEDLKKQIEEQGGSITDPLTALLDSVSSLIPEPIIIGESPKVELETTSATISWRTDKNSTSFVAFVRDDQYDSQKDEPYVSVVGNPEDSVKEHIVKIANILPATKYHYQVRSKALLGGMSKSKDFTFITKSALPEISNYLQKKTEDEKTAAVYWETNVPSDSVVKYTPYVSGKLEKKLAKIIGKSDMVTDHEVSVTELNPGTIYQFEISSRDPFGNVVSKVLPDFTTAIDKDAPVVSQVRIESAMVSGKTPRIQTIVSYKTDEPALGQVMFTEGGSNDFKEMAMETAFSATHTAVITEFKPASIYRIRVVAKDNSENIAASRDFTILTPAKSESIIDIIVRTFENTFGWMKNIRF